MTRPDPATRDLYPTTGPSGEIIVRDIGGPLRPNRPELTGHMDFRCPHCRTALVEGTTTDGVRGIRGLQCYQCHKWSSGLPWRSTWASRTAGTTRASRPCGRRPDSRGRVDPMGGSLLVGVPSPVGSTAHG